MFRAPDGKEFSDRAAYRKHLFLTQYTFKDRDSEILRKLPGDIDGQPFDLTSLRRCEVALLDRSEAVQVDELTDCRVFIAACVDSVFVRNCTGCIFTVACKQLRTRDCEDCEFRLYCKTEPIIETSHGMTFAPFNGAYVGHAEHLRAASLTTPNLWFGVYDFNDEAKTGNNWRLLDEEERGDDVWRPLHDNSEVAIPVTKPGSVPLPSKRTGGGGGGGGGGTNDEAAPVAPTGKEAAGVSAGGSSTLSFSFTTSASEAEAAVHTQMNASIPSGRKAMCTASAPPVGQSFPVERGPSVIPPPGTRDIGTGAKIGWDPSRVGDGDGAAGGRSTAAAREGRDCNGGVGWDSSRLPVANSAGTNVDRGRKADASDAVVDGTAVAPPPEGNGAKPRIGWDPSRLSTAGSGNLAKRDAGVASPDAICSGEARSNVPPRIKASDPDGDESADGRTNQRATAAPAAAPGSGPGAAPSAPPISNPSSGSVHPAAAGKPAAAGGGGGAIALASPQQPVGAGDKGGGGAGWSLSGTGVVAGGKTATSVIPGSGTHGRVVAAVSVGGEGRAGDALPRELPLQQRQQRSSQPQQRSLDKQPSLRRHQQQEEEGQQGQQQQQQQQKVGWDPARLSTTRATEATAGSSITPVGAGTPAAGASGAPEKELSETRVARARPASASTGKVGWNASRIGNPAVPAPVAASRSSTTPPSVEAQLVASDAETNKIGWNASRVGNPAVPAPTKMKKETGAPTAAAVAAAVTAAVAVAGRTSASDGAVGKVAVAAQGRGERRVEVPLQLRAVLIYASTQRGIDLRKWFDVGDGDGDEGGEEEEEAEGSGQQATNAAPTLLTVVQFELVLAGLAEGLKAGLSEEERVEIDAAIAPEVVALAAAVATLPGSEGAADDGRKNGDGGSSDRDVVDVGRFLDLCGIPPSAPPSEQQTRKYKSAGRASLPVPPATDSGSEKDSDDQGCFSEETIDDDTLANALTHEGESRGRGKELNIGTHGRVARGGGGRDERAAAAAATAAADEMALRRISHQADLYGRLMACVGLKQPVGCSSQGAFADWEAFLRVSSVPLEVFRAALGQVGLQLSRERAMALATRACGSLSAAPHVAASAKSRANSDRQNRNEKTRSSNTAATRRNSVGGSKPVGSIGNGSCGVGMRHGKSGIAEDPRRLAQPRRTDQRKTTSSSLSGPQHQRKPTGKGRNQQQQQQKRRQGHQRRQHAGYTTAGGNGSRASSRSSSVSLGKEELQVRSPPRRRPLRTPAPAHPPLRKKPKSHLMLPAWDLRRYLLRLRCEPKSKEARCDQQQRRRRRHLSLGGRKEEQRQGSNSDGGVFGESGEWTFGAEDAAGGGADADVGENAETLTVFAAWGKRIREERAERERQRKRDFQRALAGRPHSLTLEQLLECVSRFEIMPPQILSREMHAMSEAFSESVEGSRRAREIARRWSQASPASRNTCGPDDADQHVWEHVQALSGAQRRARAMTMVVKQREEELAESEVSSAAVSRSIFLAYARNTRAVGGGGEAVSLQRWLEDRQAAMKKARELEAARERAQALSKADTDGRKALVSELKEELLRLVGSTKKTQKVESAPGMEVLRSSREGLDIHRRLKRLDAAAAEEERARKQPNGRSPSRNGDAGERQPDPNQQRKHQPRQPTTTSSPAPPLLSKRAFNAEMGDVLFSLTADGATAARARQLAGVPFIEADLRKKWISEGDSEDDAGVSPGKKPQSPAKGRETGLPSATELFGLEEALLVGRGKKDADQKRELAIEKYREWSKEKGREARKAKKVRQARQAEQAEREKQKRVEGLKAHRRWLRLASKERYFSAQSNKAVPRARASLRPGSPSSRPSSSLRGHDAGSKLNPTFAIANIGNGTDGDDKGGGRQRRRRHWDSSTEGADEFYRAATAGLPDFL